MCCLLNRDHVRDSEAILTGHIITQQTNRPLQPQSTSSPPFSILLNDPSNVSSVKTKRLPASVTLPSGIQNRHLSA